MPRALVVSPYIAFLGVYLFSRVLIIMRQRNTIQARLTDFDSDSKQSETRSSRQKRSGRREKKGNKGHIWRPTIKDGEKWGVVEFDGTVLFVQVIKGRLHAHGREAICRYCGGTLVIRGDQVFCGGKCGKFQGNFSFDLNAYLRWDGAKSFTLRNAIAEAEGLELEERDLEPIAYAPNWSVLYEYEDEPME